MTFAVNGSSPTRVSASNDDVAFKLASKMIEEFQSAKQSCLGLIVVFKDPATSNVDKLRLLGETKPVLARMADNLVLAGANKSFASNSSDDSKGYLIEAADLLIQDAKSDADKLKTLRNTYVASLPPDPAVTESDKKAGEHAERKTVSFEWRANKYDGTP
ncbi:hypothetical protein KVG88_09290 [Pseudomonas sp. SWRI74]|uniref:VWFA domain-containing protein n=1 Tax=Pseudomonas azerbaijanoccidentalis TaxID=2842347 RepID=A0ABS6QNI7_9PSED|nr:hypothetical protein [Pseudomonas azerbaijanoccidentalis]MBV4520255.1 hypothetical protein [Pseudomonas azerbaijanoccidentalis]